MTFSTFMYEGFSMLRRHQVAQMLAYMALSVVSGIFSISAVEALYLR